MKFIKNISENTVLNEVGNVTVTGNIGRGAKVFIDNGNLTVLAKIDNDCNITVKGNFKGVYIGNNVSIKTENGNVVFHTAGDDCLISANNGAGRIICYKVGSNTENNFKASKVLQTSSVNPTPSTLFFQPTPQHHGTVSGVSNRGPARHN